MITQHHYLTEKQLRELNTLVHDCRANDKNIIPLYEHLLIQERTWPSIALCYQKKRLIGFIGLFFFYENAAEVSLMTTPRYRQQGVATKLLSRMLPLIQQQQIKTLIFSTPTHINNHWLTLKGLSYQHSEYEMQYHSSPNNVSLKKEDTSSDNMLTIRPAIAHDIPALLCIDEACFPQNEPNTEQHFYQLLHSNATVLLAEKAGKAIGKAHITWKQDHAKLTDIAVMPFTQKQGIGYKIISHCIHLCLHRTISDIRLDVEVTNEEALKLYLRLGFIIKNAYDFWSIPVGK